MQKNQPETPETPEKESILKERWFQVTCLILALAIAAAVALPLTLIGPNQKQAAGSGETATVQITNSDADLVVSRVTAVDCSDEYSAAWYVIGYATNQTTKECHANYLATTIFDSTGNVLGNQTTYLGPVYPPGRWISSQVFMDISGIPARAEIKISGLVWSDITETASIFKTIQANYFPGSYGTCKVTGQFEYQGPAIQILAVRAVLLGEDGIPVGMVEQGIPSVSPGTIPFELRGMVPKSPVASVEVYYVPQ